MAGGRSLILVPEPGDPNAYQYRATADATYARYERIKIPGSGAKWRVYSTDGSIRYFGESAQTSKCANVSEDFAPLTREVSPFGDEVSYAYSSGASPDECRIETIKWGQNAGAGIGTFAQVDFTYSPSPSCEGMPVGAHRDLRSNVMIVTGASKLTTITATAFAPGGTPAAAVHTRQISLGYDVTQEQCNLQHAPIRLLTSITESAWGVDSPLVTLPAKTFTYNSPTTALIDPGGQNSPPFGASGESRPFNLAWGFRHNDDRGPTIEGMMLDVDGDGLLDRLVNDSVDPQGRTFECRAKWYRNTRLDASGNPVFDMTTQRVINLPRLKWRGTGTSTSAGSVEADRTTGPTGWLEGCSLSGQTTAFRNSGYAGVCHDGSACAAATDPKDSDSYCNIPSKGTVCPGTGGPGGADPNNARYITYLNYRWLDADADGLVDLVAAVNGSINVYDIEKGNNLNFNAGEPSMYGIPGYGVPGTPGAWPPCPGAGTYNTCIESTYLQDGQFQTCTGSLPCITNWGAVLLGLDHSSTHHTGCANVMAKGGPLGPGDCAITGGCGGGGDGSTRAPYERCQGLYPWLIYRNLGRGSFSPTPTIKYQPVPLESDNGDSSLSGPGVVSTNHAVMDFDGDRSAPGCTTSRRGRASTASSLRSATSRSISRRAGRAWLT
jgi:hypothetical protein